MIAQELPFCVENRYILCALREGMFWDRLPFKISFHCVFVIVMWINIINSLCDVLHVPWPWSVELNSRFEAPVICPSHALTARWRWSCIEYWVWRSASQSHYCSRRPAHYERSLPCHGPYIFMHTVHGVSVECRPATSTSQWHICTIAVAKKMPGYRSWPYPNSAGVIMATVGRPVCKYGDSLWLFHAHLHVHGVQTGFWRTTLNKIHLPFTF